MTTTDPPAMPSLWWSPSWGVLTEYTIGAGTFYDHTRAALDALRELPADAVRLVHEEDVDDLRLRLWQEHDAARAAGIPRGTIVAAQSVVGNILMNAPESMSLQEIAVAIVDEVAGALAVLPGDAGAVPDTGQAREPDDDPMLSGWDLAEHQASVVLDRTRGEFEASDRAASLSDWQADALRRAGLLAWPSGDTVQAPDVAARAAALQRLWDAASAADSDGAGDLHRLFTEAFAEFAVITGRDVIAAIARALLGTDTTPDRLAWISEAGETAAVERQSRYQETACARRPAEETPDV